VVITALLGGAAQAQIGPAEAQTQAATEPGAEAATAPATQESIEDQNQHCFQCHAQDRLGTYSPEARRALVIPATQPSDRYPGPRPELVVKPDALANSVHANVACVDCHPKARKLFEPNAKYHDEEQGPAVCDGECHKPASLGYAQGAHGLAAARGDPDVPTCTTCHGTHDMRSKKDRESTTFPLNIVKICGDCHAKHAPVDGRDGAVHVRQFYESVHGQALKEGLAVAATCADCHGDHKVLPQKDGDSTVNRANVTTTCGKCHTGVAEKYLPSVHGQALAKELGDTSVPVETKAPVCNDCHGEHTMTRTDAPAFKLDVVKECGTCHDKSRAGSTSKRTMYDTYRMSYHGQVTALGTTLAARCSDCHKAHGTTRLDDPDSNLSEANRLTTCQKCHPQANVKFVQYQPHADYRDSAHFPLLYGVWWYFIVVMSLSFGFFGLHSILWLVRSAIERLRHGPRPVHPSGGPAIRRFTRVDRVNHALVIISFFGLTLTGLPLLFSDKGWGRALAGMLGGPWFAGRLHRFFAVLLIANFLVHLVGVVRRFRKHGVKNMLFGPASMLPRWKDFTDCLGMWRWFIMGGKKPAFDRWTYWEKFDYAAEVGGSLIIGVSGLMLWFVVFFSSFLPGWMFNVAMVVHGYEALLAIGFIFTIHFFNAHLRLEKFPVDDVMFSGSLPEEELKEERGAEYARLAKTGALQALRVPAAERWERVVAVTLGIAAMAIGMTLVVLIILAGLGWI
jgi:cytochrome b subunit of formate dehydrogenase